MSLRPLLRMRPLRALLLCCGLLALAGCMGGDGGGSLFSQPDPVKHYFALMAQREAKVCADSQGKVLKIRRTRIAPTYESRELVYKTGQDSFATDYYNLFLVAPQDMLSEAVLEWFSGSGLFGHVVPGTSTLRPDYVLESSTTRLYGDFSTPGKAKAVLEMEFFLLEDVLAQYRVAFCRDYMREVPLDDHSPEGLVAALQQAMVSIFTSLEQDVARTLGASEATQQSGEQQSTE